ncbi:hypothetical protein Goklo_023184 [Gossypium klotzschianum]|uniref:Uncharacterized protein n=1 Tax=Gossypium klotzschianum TaxID=34286 RepID=A0A7J8TPR8_9ROSI|nr:hypothetical protein [Gossypium klotzschianum]
MYVGSYQQSAFFWINTEVYA